MSDDKDYYLYIFAVGGLVKVGISTNVDKRLCEVSGTDVLLKHLVGDYVEALLLEHRCHNLLEAFRVKNEYFNCDHQKAVRVVNKIIRYLDKMYDTEPYIVDATTKVILEREASSEGICKRFATIQTLIN
jgi:hypothetical protein